MKFSAVCLTLLAGVITLSSVEGIKEPPKHLAIGIKKRIPAAECTRKTKVGDVISVHYTGTTFDDGKEFDSSRSRGPFDFTLGGGQVIKGWDQGLVGMCIGEKRKLVIPYNLAYGEAGSPPRIPPKATLVFETELIDIKESKKKDPSEDDFLSQLENGFGKDEKLTGEDEQDEL